MNALILGRASTLWDEIDQARAIGQFGVIIATNRVGRDYPGLVQHWVSYHPAGFMMWMNERKAKGLPDHPAQLWSGIYNKQKCGEADPRLEPLVKYVECRGGSTGLLATVIAVRELGIDRSVLCGIPLEKTARYDDPTPWSEGHSYRKAWNEHFDMFKDRVKSMSGWTRELLGAPTREWLNASDTQGEEVGGTPQT